MKGKDSRSRGLPQNPKFYGPVDPDKEFQRRLESWRGLHLMAGPGRSYPYSWRLPDLAKHLGSQAWRESNHAYALDLFTLGRARDASLVLDLIPREQDSGVEFLRARVAITLGGRIGPEGSMGLMERAWLRQMANEPQDVLDVLANLAKSDPWVALLEYWALSTMGWQSDVRRPHRALAKLRHGPPTLAARGEALWAEAQFRFDPQWAIVWLDHAWDCCVAYGQHDLCPGLLSMKSVALAAGGDFGAAKRCERALLALHRRQKGRNATGDECQETPDLHEIVSVKVESG